MTRTKIAMGALILATLASLCANVYLARDAGRIVAERPASTTPSTSTRPRFVRLRAPRPAAEPSFARDCPGQVGILERKLVDAQRRLDLRLSLDEKFERGAPSAESERWMRELVEKVFGADRELAPFETVCRGAICRMYFRGADHEFMERIRGDSLGRGAFSSRSFASTTVEDPITKKRRSVQKVMVELVDEATVTGRAVVNDIATAVWTSARLAQCKVQHPAPGYVIFRIDIDPDAHRVTVEESGSLSGKPGGECVRAILDDVIATTSVPATAGPVGRGCPKLEIDIP